MLVPIGSDRSLQRRFLIDDTLFQSRDICNKVAKNAYMKTKFFGHNSCSKLDAENICLKFKEFSALYLFYACCKHKTSTKLRTR